MLTKSDIEAIKEIVHTETELINRNIKTLKSDVAKIRKGMDFVKELFDFAASKRLLYYCFFSKVYSYN